MRFFGNRWSRMFRTCRCCSLSVRHLQPVRSRLSERIYCNHPELPFSRLSRQAEPSTFFRICPPTVIRLSDPHNIGHLHRLSRKQDIIPQGLPKRQRVPLHLQYSQNKPDRVWPCSDRKPRNERELSRFSRQMKDRMSHSLCWHRLPTHPLLLPRGRNRRRRTSRPSIYRRQHAPETESHRHCLYQAGSFHPAGQRLR
eukprot:TRINITY_DN5532_c0_g2_i1.p3 TRINITY_DN5532_c0_g2~~TRINITY_DN5532_c0_g2_i1.p3  ORF type:complete len:198 (+),score=-29.54 TRINITY_DN5532_c0_g2_i1:700-1293(+)